MVIGHFGLIECIGLNGHTGRKGLTNHMSLVGHTDLASASINSLSLISFIGLSISFIGLGISYTGLIGLIIGPVGHVNLDGISLISLMGLIGGHISYGLGLVGLISLIGRIGLNGHNDIVSLINKMEFEIPCYLFVREGWLWCVRRLSSLAGLNLDFFFGHALQYAKQVFLDRIPQVNKYFVMRECGNSYTKSLCCDSAFAHKKEFSIFKLAKKVFGDLFQRSHFFFFSSFVHQLI
jgi:hypothetical protein